MEFLNTSIINKAINNGFLIQSEDVTIKKKNDGVMFKMSE